jgi:hypothetical protein
MHESLCFSALQDTETLQCMCRMHADIINTLCETPMAVALLIALLLDNTVPGTWAERGLHHWNLRGTHRDMDARSKLAYDLPYGLSEKVHAPADAPTF